MVLVFWNLQGGGGTDITKWDVIKQLLQFKHVDVFCFCEVSPGIKDKYTGGLDVGFYPIVDKNDKPTPKCLAIFAKPGIFIKDICDEIQLEEVDIDPHTTSGKTVKVKRPLLKATTIKTGFDLYFLHAPAFPAGGKAVRAEIFGILEGEVKANKNYQAVVIGDYNCQYEDLQSGTAVVKTVDPGLKKTQKSGGKLDYMVSCNIAKVSPLDFGMEFYLKVEPYSDHYPVAYVF